MEFCLVGDDPFTHNTVDSAMKSAPAYAELVDKWKVFGRDLGIDIVDLNILERKMRIDSTDGMIIFDVLFKWRSQKGKQATLKTLYDVLVKEKHAEIADKIEEMYKKHKLAASIHPKTDEVDNSEKRFRSTQLDPVVPLGTITANGAPHAYDVKHGKAIIIAHQDFANNDERECAKKDIERLDKCLKSLRFEVEVLKDKSKKLMLDSLKKVSEETNASYDCLVVCVSTHGDENLLCTYNETYHPEELWTPFVGDKCPSLAGKPKLFFISACRGSHADSGSNLPPPTSTASLGNRQIFTIPNWADFLVAFSTVEGYVSYDFDNDGSVFFKYLTEVINKHKNTEDMLSMLTITCGEIAHKFTSYSSKQKEYDGKKQIPMIVSTLTKKVKFT